MTIEWSGDGTPADGLRIERNLAALLRDLTADAPLRRLPTIGMARAWHLRVFDGVPAPVPYFVGGVRDSDPTEPELVDYEVAVRGPAGVAPGVIASRVYLELAAFKATFREKLVDADQLHPYAGRSSLSGPGDS